MSTASNNHQSAESPEEPTATDLALIAAQLVRSGGRKLKEGDTRCTEAAEVAYGLWSAANVVLKAKRKGNGGATERVREFRRQQVKELGVTEPAVYPVELREFLALNACPGRSHADRLAKYRAWMRSLGESDDISEFRKLEEFLAFSAMAIRFQEWLKQQRSEAARRARASKNPENGH